MRQHWSSTTGSDKLKDMGIFVGRVSLRAPTLICGAHGYTPLLLGIVISILISMMYHDPLTDDPPVYINAHFVWRFHSPAKFLFSAGSMQHGTANPSVAKLYAADCKRRTGAC